MRRGRVLGILAILVGLWNLVAGQPTFAVVTVALGLLLVARPSTGPRGDEPATVRYVALLVGGLVAIAVVAAVAAGAVG